MERTLSVERIEPPNFWDVRLHAPRLDVEDHPSPRVPREDDVADVRAPFPCIEARTGPSTPDFLEEVVAPSGVPEDAHVGGRDAARLIPQHRRDQDHRLARGVHVLT